MKNALTAKEISKIVGITGKAVRKNKRAERYVIGLKISGVGRPTKLYRRDVLDIWFGVGPEDPVEKDTYIIDVDDNTQIEIKIKRK